MQKNMIIAGIVGIFALLFIMDSAFILDPTQQALILKFGEPKRVIQSPGLYWKMPFVESLIFYDKRILSLNIPPEEVIAADKNRLVIDTYTCYRIIDPLRFYQKAGTEERAMYLLQAQISPDLRKTLGKYAFRDLLSSKRKEIMAEVLKEVSTSSDSLGIKIVDVRIRRVDLPRQNSESIYRRMKSERERFATELRAKGKEKAQTIQADADRESVIILAEAQKRSEIERGEGEANAAQVYAKAYSGNEFYDFYRSLAAYEVGLKGSTFVINPKENSFFKFWP